MAKAFMDHLALYQPEMEARLDFIEVIRSAQKDWIKKWQNKLVKWFHAEIQTNCHLDLIEWVAAETYKSSFIKELLRIWKSSTVVFTKKITQNKIKTKQIHISENGP